MSDIRRVVVSRFGRAGYRLPALAVLSGAIVGCQSYSAPKVTIEGVSIGESTDAGMTLIFELEATNGNKSAALPLEQIRTTFSMDGRPVFNGRRSPEVTLQAGGIQRFSVPVAIAYDKVDGPLVGKRDYRLACELTYRVPGTFADLMFDTSVRRPTTTFGEQGRIDFETTQLEFTTDGDAQGGASE